MTNRYIKTGLVVALMSTTLWHGGGLGDVHACTPAEFRIAIDAGHTPKNPGATSARGIPEYVFNRRLAQELASALQKRGFQSTLLINEDGKEIDLEARTRAAHDFKADLFLSLHHDSVQPKYLQEWYVAGVKNKYSDNFSGYSLFYSQNNVDPESSRLFATMLGDELIQRGRTPTLHHAEPIAGENRPLVDSKRGIYQFDDLIVLKTASMPAVLIEGGIILNRTEEKWLNKTEYREVFVTAIVEAIQLFCDKHAEMSERTPTAASRASPVTPSAAE